MLQPGDICLLLVGLVRGGSDSLYYINPGKSKTIKEYSPGIVDYSLYGSKPFKQ